MAGSRTISYPRWAGSTSCMYARQISTCAAIQLLMHFSAQRRVAHLRNPECSHVPETGILAFPLKIKQAVSSVSRPTLQ
eukprot:SM000413S15645  [mRNA]  locus=s413:32123:33509:+ [translate_table: standard]